MLAWLVSGPWVLFWSCWFGSLALYMILSWCHELEYGKMPGVSDDTIPLYFIVVSILINISMCTIAYYYSFMFLSGYCLASLFHNTNNLFIQFIKRSAKD